MGPPSGGRQPITNRYMRHFNTIYVEQYDSASLNNIFTAIINWYFNKFSSPSYPKTIASLGPNAVACAIDIYNQVSQDLRPTPSKSHYTYNLRDLSKMF